MLHEGPEGQPCTMVVRTLHWTVPHYWLWGLPFYLFYSPRLPDLVSLIALQRKLKSISLGKIPYEKIKLIIG
ncbi:hypothetical protein V6Z11_D13G230800 [Gossypium hirsutum]